VPSLTEDLLSSVDQPLTIARCRKTGRDYLLCDYNRDGDSYRSPWSGEFETPQGGSGAGGVDDQGNNDGAGEGAVPSERVRKMEIRANEAFDVYRELYYEGGVSSVYFWNLDDGFAGVVLLKKGTSPIPRGIFCGADKLRSGGALGEESGDVGLDPRIRGRRSGSHGALQAHEHGDPVAVNGQ
jgi:hypothetical protein